MGLVYIGNSGSYRYGIWKMEEEPANLSSGLSLDNIPEFKALHRKLEYTSIRRLAQTMGINPQNIAYTVSGKPFLKDLPETHISITHCRDYAAFMLSQHPGIGIDIEQCSERIFRIRSRFMHEEEEYCLQAMLNSQGKTYLSEMTALFIHWCAKEAMYKALDLPGVDFKRDFRLDIPLNLETEGKLKACFIPQQVNFNIDYHIREEYILTCCSLK